MRIRRTIVVPVESESNTGIVNKNVGYFSRGNKYDLYLVDTLSRHDIKNGADVIIKDGDVYTIKQFPVNSYDIVLGVPVAKNEQLTDKIVDKFISDFQITFDTSFPKFIQVFIYAYVNAFDKDGNHMDYAFEDSDYLEVQAFLDENGKVIHKTFAGDYFKESYVPQIKINKIKEETCRIFENDILVGEVNSGIELHDVCIQVKEKQIENVKIVSEEGYVYDIDLNGMVYSKGNPRLYPTVGEQLRKSI